MAIIDIVVLVIFVLYLLFGLKNGFLKSVIGILGLILTFVAVIFLSQPFADLLKMILPFNDWITKPILQGLESNGGIMVAPVVKDVEVMVQALATFGIPSFIGQMFAPNLVSAIPDNLENTTLAQFVAPAISNLIVVAIAGVILFILVRILIMIVQHFIHKATAIGAVGVVDRILGVAFGAVKGALIVFIGFTVLALVVDFGFMKPVKDDLNNSTVSKFVYENNFVAKWIFEQFNFSGQTGEGSKEEQATNQDVKSDFFVTDVKAKNTRLENVVFKNFLFANAKNNNLTKREVYEMQQPNFLTVATQNVLNTNYKIDIGYI